MDNALTAAVSAVSRSPYGERGLKFPFVDFPSCRIGRSPYGERGLKFDVLALLSIGFESLSLRRAWIEITKHS